MAFKLYNIEHSKPSSPPSMEEQEILKRCDEIIGEGQQAKSDIKKIMESSYLSFRSIANDFTFQRRDIERYGLAIFVPITFQVIASIQAQLNGRPPMYSISAMNAPSDRETAKLVEKLSKNEYRRAQVSREIATGTQLSLIFGTSFLRSYLRYDKKKAKFITGVGEDGIPLYEEQERDFYYGHSVTNDHPLKVLLPAVHEHDPQKWPWYVVRELADVEETKRYYELHPELAYKKNYKELTAGGDLTDDMEVYFKIDPTYRWPDMRYPGNIGDFYTRSSSTGGKSYASLSKKKLVEKYRIYNQQDDEWVVIANGRVLEYHPNPVDSKILPVVAMRDYKVEFSPWGMGEPQLLRYIQMEANALHTFAMDGTKFATNGVFAVNPNGLKNPNDMSVYPGKVFELKNMPGLQIDSIIQSLNAPDVKGSVFRMLGINSQMAYQTSGTGSAVIGGDQVQNASATESNNVKAAATTRIYERARSIEQENLCDLIRHQIDFMANFYNKEMVFKVTDNEYMRFVPGSQSEFPLERAKLDAQAGYTHALFSSDLEQGYDVVVEGESTLPISLSEKRMEGMQLLKIAAETRRPITAEEMAKNPNLPQLYPQGVPVLDANAVAKNVVLPTYSIVDNADEFMWKPEDVAAPDRERKPGRPDSPFSEEDMSAVQNASPASETNLMAAAQPNNQGVNQSERML